MNSTIPHVRVVVGFCLLAAIGEREYQSSKCPAVLALVSTNRNATEVQNRESLPWPCC